MTETQALAIQPHPFHDTVITTVRSGQTLRQMLVECAGSEALAAGLVVRVGGHSVPESMWHRVRPKAGAHIYVGANPLAGNSKWTRTILMIVVSVVAAWAGGYVGGAEGLGLGSTWGAVAQAGVMIAGTLLVNAVVPLEAGASSLGGGEAARNWNQLTGTQNAINPWGVIPLVIGESRHYPPHAAMPYSEYLGEEVYQHCLFDLGFLNPGAIVEDIRIGDTPLADYEDVEYQILPTTAQDVVPGFSPGTFETWTKQLASGEASYVADPDTATGTFVQLGNNAGNDAVAAFDSNFVPFNPTRTYVIRYRYRRTAGTGNVWLQLMGKSADGQYVNNMDVLVSGPARYCDFVVNDTTSSGWVTGAKHVRGTQSGPWGIEFGSGEAWDPIRISPQIASISPKLDANNYPDSGHAGQVDFDYLYIEEASGPLYANDNDEEFVNAVLEDGTNPTPGTVVSRTTAADITNISVDFVFPQGLMWVDNATGEEHELGVWFKVTYRKAGTADAFGSPNNIRYAGCRQSDTDPAFGAVFVNRANKHPFSFGMSWDVPRGQYEVQVTRLWADHTGTQFTHLKNCTWVTLRSTREVEPSTTGTHKLAMRIKASDQLNGTLQNLSCLVRNTYRQYDPVTATWSDWQTSTSPAWACLDLLRSSPAVGANVADSVLDLTTWYDFAQFCDPHAMGVRMVLDVGVPLRDLLNQILQTALASVDYVNGKYSVVWDRAQTAPSAYLMPTELRDFSVQRPFARIPHALRVQFRNPGANWGNDEIVVVRDGYSHNGKGPRGEASADPQASEFETLELQAAMPAQQAWRFARYHFAQALFRPTVYNFSTDIAGLGINRGDMIGLAHDVAGWCIAAGRVASLTAGGPSVFAATLQLEFEAETETEPGTSYRARLRTDDGASTAIDATPHSPRTNTFYLPTLPAGYGQGDSCVIAVAEQESPGVIITRKRVSGTTLETEFVAVNYDPRVPAYWADPPATIASEITGATYRKPTVPVIQSIVSAPDNDSADNAGIKRTTVRINLVQLGYNGITPQPAVYETRWRLMPIAPATEPTGWTVDREVASPSITLEGFIAGRTYQVQVKAVAANGESSAYTAVQTLAIPSANTGSLALPVNTAQKAGVWDVDTVVEYSATDTSATINLSAATFVVEGKTINYAASSVVVTGAALAEKTFWLYYIDPNLAGGTRTLYATDSYTTAIGGSGNIIVTPVPITFPDVGGTSGGSGGVGGGGTVPPSCPWVGAHVEEQTQGWITAGSVRHGHWLRLWSGDWGMVVSARNTWRPGYRITTARGVVLDCSDTAPIRVPNGRINARHLTPGMELYAHDNEWDGVDTVASVDFLGIIEVMTITLANESASKLYRVGNVAGRTLDHHNLKTTEEP